MCWFLSNLYFTYIFFLSSGSLFAGFYFIEALSTLIFEIVFNTVYAETLSIMRGIVFLLIASMLLISIIIFM